VSPFGSSVDGFEKLPVKSAVAPFGDVAPLATGKVLRNSAIAGLAAVLLASEGTCMTDVAG